MGPSLWISAKDGVQAQTRILFHALRKMNIPTVIFINKIDQAGVDLQSVVQSVRDKLSADIIIKQTVSLSPEIVLEENTDIEAWDAVIENNDEIIGKSISQENQSAGKNLRGRKQQRVQTPPCSQSIMAAPKMARHSTVDGCGDRLFQPIGEQGAPPMRAFSRLSTPIAPAACLSTVIQRNAAPRGYGGPGRERKLKITEMRIPSKGEIVRTDTAYQGEIVILPSDSVRLNDVLGDQTRLPRKRWREDPSPCCGRRLRRKRQRKENGCWTLLRNLRILTRFCVAKWIPSPMRSFFLFWAGCSWSCFRFAVGKIQA